MCIIKATYKLVSGISSKSSMVAAMICGKNNGKEKNQITERIITSGMIFQNAENGIDTRLKGQNMKFRNILTGVRNTTVKGK